MQLVWSLPSTDELSKLSNQALSGRHQDMLRSVGAWLDARGYRLSRLSASGETLMVEVETGQPGDDLGREVFRLDYESLDRLTQAALADRDRFQRVS